MHNYKLKFSTAINESRIPLEYVHVNLWGSHKVGTHSSKHYFLSIKYYYCRYVSVYFIKTKNKCLPKFKELKIKVENQYDRKLKFLWIDNGLKFVNTEFNILCSEFGIVKHRIVKHTHQQNGVAERMNRA